MFIFKYASIYLLIGAAIMIILDVMHSVVKHLVDDEFKEGYSNWERAYIIFTWPYFLIGFFRSFKNKDEENGN